MNALTTKLDDLIDVKSECKNAIINNYVDVDCGVIGYADKIREIILPPDEIIVQPNTKFGYSTFKKIPYFDSKNYTSMDDMFVKCENLQIVNKLNTSNVTNMSDMFRECRSLVSIPKLDTRNVTNMMNMFNGCISLVSIPRMDCYNVKNANYMCSGTAKLVNIGGFINLGCSLESDTYLYITGNYVTRESLINVFNDLGNINVKNISGYIIINDLSMLSADDIKIAENKGWQIWDEKSWDPRWDPQYDEFS